MEMEERIKRLESNNRLLAIGVFALVAVIAALVTAMVVKVMPDYEARLNAQANHYDLALGDLRSDIDAG